MIDALNRVLEARQSCRGYLPDAVARSDIEEVLRTAQKVPSWCNSQPWQVVACGVEETARFRTALQAHVQRGQGGSDVAFPAAYEGVYQRYREQVRALQ